MFTNAMHNLRDAPKFVRYPVSGAILLGLLLIAYAVISPLTFFSSLTIRTEACFWGGDASPLQKGIKRLGNFVCSEPNLLGNWYYEAEAYGTKWGGIAQVRPSDAGTLYIVKGTRLWLQRQNGPLDCLTEIEKRQNWISEAWSRNANGFLFYYTLELDDAIEGVMRLTHDVINTQHYNGRFYDEIKCSDRIAKKVEGCRKILSSPEFLRDGRDYLLEKGTVNYYREIDDDKCAILTASN
ncbi:hypothetical protein D1O30_06690 [Methylocystis hirsuta]|uniref:Uncharacterized protein n=2 Tax=Methylocystis hirsuta TaxID=369798 RepID=A0A3M9XM23_9HYPH|nr:hypothetical protein D1O30_06690 [Methylocystis hirsuta]